MAATIADTIRRAERGGQRPLLRTGVAALAEDGGGEAGSGPPPVHGVVRSTSTAEVYEKVLSVVSDARGYYDVDDPLVAGVGDAEFMEMMFLDGASC